MNSEDRSTNGSSRGWLERISRFFGGEPQDREDLVELLKLAEERNLLDSEVLDMMLGAMLVSERRVRDIMTPRPQLVILHRDDDLDEVLRVVTDSLHSRIPVVGEDTDEVEGVLLPKDLLSWMYRKEGRDFRIKDLLREVLIVPESMRLNSLLKELRHNRNHMAIVVDEYGSTAGLVTLEDVLEQIVGDIEDEHDDPPVGTSMEPPNDPSNTSV
jgi:magnesium and cobalt transporter